LTKLTTSSTSTSSRKWKNRRRLKKFANPLWASAKRSRRQRAGLWLKPEENRGVPTYKWNLLEPPNFDQIPHYHIKNYKIA
jgi:hypothetical protein